MKTKAAETRHLGKPLLDMFKDFAGGDDDEVHWKISRALEVSVELENIQLARNAISAGRWNLRRFPAHEVILPILGGGVRCHLLSLTTTSI